MLALAVPACDGPLTAWGAEPRATSAAKELVTAESSATTDVESGASLVAADEPSTADASGEPTPTPAPTSDTAVSSAAGATDSRTIGTRLPLPTPLRVVSTKIPTAPRFRPGLSVKQAIVVKSAAWTSTSATVEVWERSNATSAWTLRDSGTGRVGRSGIKTIRSEGDGSTPAGYFRILWGFGTGPSPNSHGMTWRTFDDNDYWVSDPEHAPTYNTYQTSRTSGWRTTHAEWLWDFRTLYQYSWVIDYNYPHYGTRPASEPQPVLSGPGSGSAIFLHVEGSGPTAGCVSIPQARLAELSGWFDEAKNPVIIIGEDDWLAEAR